MIIIYIILILTGILFLNVFLNLIFFQRLNFDDIRGYPLVSVLIPARNEEKNIKNILIDIQRQNYQNIEVLVFNDDSTDRTGEILENIAKHETRLQIIQSNDLPENWLGKNLACHVLAKKAKGDYLLFLDADVRAKNDLIKKTLAYCQKYDLQLLTIFPKQTMKTLGEKLTVPLMHYILLTLLPLIFVRKSPFVSHSAANGQFMLFEAKTYKKYFPHEYFKSEKIEDIRISRLYKSQKRKIACLTGTDEISCRMYYDFKESVNGFAKNIAMFFGNSYALAILFLMLNILGLVTLLCYSNWIYLIMYLVLLLSIRIIFSWVAKQNALMNILLFYPQMIVMLLIICKSITGKLRKRQIWKGRFV